jgi:hypothetical protein
MQYPQQIQASVSSVIHHQLNADYVAFFHAAFGSPPITTFISALRKGFLGNLPRLTSKMVMANPPNSLATAKGHLDLTRQGLHSSTHNMSMLDSHEQIKDTNSPDTIESDILDQPIHADIETYVKLLDMSQTSHSDATGRFPVTSLRGNNYILVSVFNGYIHAEPLQSRSGSEFVKAYRSTITHLRSYGHNISFQRLDNETSGQLEAYLRAEGIVIQFVPPNNHRANKAERAIRTFKNHLLSILATSHPSFPLNLWDELIPQANLTINLLHPFSSEPKMSAYQGITGKTFDFLAHPIAPCGTQVLIHEAPTIRSSWAPHGISGYYLGPALDHYRCFRVFAVSTQSVRISDSLAWFPVALHMPGSSPIELLQATLQDLSHVLTSMGKENILPHQRQPFDHLHTSAVDALKTAIDLFHFSSDETPSLPRVSPADEHHSLPRVISTQPQEDQLNNSKYTIESQPNHQANQIKNPSIISQVSLPEDIIPPNASNGHNSDRPQRSHRTPDRYLAQIEKVPRVYTAVDLDAEGEPLTYRSAKRGPDSKLWEIAETEELDRLLTETSTMRFIHHHEKPKDRKASYYNPQVRTKVKDNILVRRVRGTIGGDRIDYPGDKAASTADVITLKLLLNAVVSEDAEWLTADIKDFYLKTTLLRKEYMTIHRRHLPRDIQQRYQLDKLWRNDSVLVEISGGIYGLPQAGKLAQDRLVAHLAKHGYIAAPNTPCLFQHISRPVTFTLVVDDFGIKYKGREHAEHLLTTLRELYTITVDWTGSKYVGFSILFDKQARTVALSMPNYVPQALKRFGITRATYATDSPMIYEAPKYGSSAPQIAPEDTSPILSADGLKRIQQIVGVFLYYARAVDPTMLTAITRLGSIQAHATQDVNAAAERFLQYAATWPQASIIYRASDMILTVHSDASYLCESKARSRAGGLHFLSTRGADPTIDINGAIECTSCIIPAVVSSAFEAEYAALFINGQTAEGIRNTLTDLGYPQQATPILSDNACAVGVATRHIKQRKSKAIDMRFHWIRDRVDQGRFAITWRAGNTNLADYFTKAHPAKHCRAMRNIFVHTPNIKSNVNNRSSRRSKLHQETIIKAISEGVLEPGHIMSPLNNKLHFAPAMNVGREEYSSGREELSSPLVQTAFCLPHIKGASHVLKHS